MIKFINSRFNSMKYAFEGWRYVITTQKNAWVHAVASIIVIAMSFWLQLSAGDWTIIILTIAFVWVVEVLNTALEVLTDLLSPEYNQLAKVSKDVSAAAVLIAAAASVLIGLLVLGPPLLIKIRLYY